MLANIFYWVLNISILGTLTGFIMLAVRAIKRLPRRAVYALWLIPFFRFILPVSFASRLSLFQIASRTFSKTVAYETATDFSSLNSIKAAESYYPIVYKTQLLERVFIIGGTIWIAVATTLLILIITLYVKNIRDTAGAVQADGNVYKSGCVKSPVVVGIFRQRIILPESTDDATLPYILQHEQTHASRHDNLWRMAAVVVCCVHWFNPFMVLFFKKFAADMEQSCDEKASKNYSENQRKEYCRAILACAQHQAVLLSPFYGAEAKARIQNVLSYKRLTIASIIFLLLFAAALAATILTNPIA